jgi:hypothetical protein
MADVSSVAADVRRHLVADRPAAGAACASMTEAVVSCDSRRCRCVSTGAQLHFPASDIVSDGQQNTRPASGSPPRRTIVRTTRKFGEYRRIRGRTYCPSASIRASIWGIPICGYTALPNADAPRLFERVLKCPRLDGKLFIAELRMSRSCIDVSPQRQVAIAMGIHNIWARWSMGSLSQMTGASSTSPENTGAALPANPIRWNSVPGR